MGHLDFSNIEFGLLELEIGRHRGQRLGRAGTENGRLIIATPGIAHDLGTAVGIVTMVFGNMGDDCATGVSCSPFRVPVARLAPAHAALRFGGGK